MLSCNKSNLTPVRFAHGPSPEERVINILFSPLHWRGSEATSFVAYRGEVHKKLLLSFAKLIYNFCNRGMQPNGLP